MALLLCLVCSGIAWQEAPPTAPATASPAMDVVTAFEKVLTDVVARTEGSVVAIHRNKEENARETQAVRGRNRPPRTEVMELPLQARLTSPTAISFDFGSGVVIGDEGEILTTFHVVRGATTLIVRAAERQEFEAEVISADPRSDLAVIAPVAGPGRPKPRLKPIPLGDSGQLRKGSFLIALGNPFNAAAQDGRANASWGILSNIARQAAFDAEARSDQRLGLQLPHYPTLLQLDSKLNLGMSGGAVVNMKGELVGLTTTAASPSGYDAMAGYAFPMDAIGRRVVQTLKEGREVEYGLLGVRYLPGPKNNVIDVVTPNSPASQGKLMPGDSIVAINDVPVLDFASLMVAVSAHAPGDKLNLKLIRNGQELEKTLVIGKFPVEGEIIASVRPASWRGLRVDHPSLMIGAPIGIVPDEGLPTGVVIREVETESPADKAGLRPYQSIRQVGDQSVSNPAEFAKAVAGLKGPVRLMTDRGPIVVEP
ncbi:trypsin-like peptidase domain-containing protein [Paludisphaera rhizosphaerae]|uniref:trypsin-like peptidase domain-containing protein n=1 Tax=Paludisphaera rhizosphaerae TaxID=2711216 RepID=UPI0013ECC935|nr:trypsin-like peptidase domain-containing protein [Paludisphaera rhizosphaerae]